MSYREVLNMATTTEEEFISNFYSLNGVTIGERKKNLFLLLNTTKASLKVTGEKINFSSLHPKSPLEENFKVDALIYFKDITELMQVLKSGNPVLIEKVLNIGSWFIKEAFANVGGKELSDEIFPHLSYNTKLKLLHRLELYLDDSKKAEEYFKAVKESYGIYIASKMLTACSKDLIMKLIEENRIEVTPDQLLTIIKNHPEVTEDIFDKLASYHKENGISQKYKMVFNYLARHDFKLFLRLREKYNITAVCLGTRSTRKMIVTEKETIMENPRNYLEILKKDKILENMKEGFDELYLNYFPKSLKLLNISEWNNHLNLPKCFGSDDEKLNYFLKAFKQVYGDELWQHSELISPRLIEMMSPDSREIWMQKYKRPEDISENKWITFMRTEKSIPLLKQQINYTSNPKQRAILITYLISTCKINKNSEALLDVLQYIISKHRNDCALDRKEIMQELHCVTESMKLTDEHWQCINKLLTLSSLKDNSYCRDQKVFLKYIVYCIENDMPIDDLLLQWAQRWPGQYDFITKKSEHKKQCLLMIIKTFPIAVKEEDLKRRCLGYLDCVCQWNEAHPKDKISPFLNAEVIKHVKLALTHEKTFSYELEWTIAKCIIFDFKKAEEEAFVEFFLRKSSFADLYIKTLNWLVRYQPQSINNHIGFIIKNLFKLQYDYLCYISKSCYRYYYHLDIVNEYCRLYLDLINDEATNARQLASKILSITLAPSEFLNLVASNYPLSSAADIESPDGQRIYRTQKTLVSNLKNINPPALALNSILEFCTGDYLNLIQSSLYSISLNVPENKLTDFLSALSKRAVSVRKHSVLITFKVLNKSKVHEILNAFLEKENNSSIRKYLFKSIFNFFKRNPDDHFWELTKIGIAKTDIKDNEVIRIFTQYKRIPQTYFADYILFTFKKLESFKDSNETIEEGKCQILEAVDSGNICKLPQDFCERVIQKYFLEVGKSNNLELKLRHFTSTYIVYYKSSNGDMEHVKPIFAKLKNYVDSSWYHSENSLECRKICSNFVTEFCSEFIENHCDDEEILITFMNLWDNILKPHEAFNEYLYMRFTLLYVRFVKNKLSLEEIGRRLTIICDSLHSQESFVVYVFYKCFKSFRCKFINYDEGEEVENLFDLIEGIRKTELTRSNLMLIIFLLSEVDVTTLKMKCKYNTILDMLMKKNDSFVQICLHNYLMKKNSY